MTIPDFFPKSRQAWEPWFEFWFWFHWSLFLEYRIVNKSLLVQVMAGCGTGAKPLPEPMMPVFLRWPSPPTHNAVSKNAAIFLLQCVNSLRLSDSTGSALNQILSIRPPGTYFNEILVDSEKFPLKKMSFKTSSAKGRPFCSGLNVLISIMLVCVLLFLNTDGWHGMEQETAARTEY